MMKMLRDLQIPILSFQYSRAIALQRPGVETGIEEKIFQEGLDSPYQVRGRNDKKGRQNNIRKFKIAFLLQPPRYDRPEV